jgi:uncharacterized phage protein gp47/JayE
MADFQRPTLASIIDRVQGDIEGAVSGVTARLRRTVEFGLSKAVAGASHHLHGHLAWLALQVVPNADMADRFVLLWAQAFLETARIAATAATGTAAGTGAGGTIPAGTELVRLADSAIFTVDTEVTDFGTVNYDVDLTAAVAGADGNTAAGQSLRLVSPIANVNSEFTVNLAAITGGTDQETIVELLARLLDNLRTPPKGGGPGDHVDWVKESGAGATRAWEYSNATAQGYVGIGERTVYFVVDGRPDITPTSGELAIAQAYVDDRSPLKVTVAAPTLVEVALTGTISTNTTAVKAAAVDELEALLERAAHPGGYTLPISQVDEAISSATGETDHALTVPAGDITYTFGQLPVPPAGGWTDA